MPARPLPETARLLGVAGSGEREFAMAVQGA